MRVLALLELLQSHGQLSGSELVRRLEVDGWTLRRYIVALEELGIPVSAERGCHGGCRLAAGFKLPPLMSSAEKTLAVSLGLLAVRSLGLGESELVLKSVRARLSRVMPGALRRHLVALHETASLDLARARAGTSVATLATLAEAAQVHARVELRYHDPQGTEILRQLDPYSLVYHDGCWYVSGFCHLRQALCSFHLDRLDAPRMLAERFERPADFDTLRHLRESSARMSHAYPVEIPMRATREQVVAVLGEPLGLLAEVDGGTLLRVGTDDLDWFARRLYGLPFDFEIGQPLELREPLRRQAERVLRNLGQEETSDHRQAFRGKVLLIARLPLSGIDPGQPACPQEATRMPAIPLHVTVLCANPGRLLRYGVLFNRCGCFHLSLCLDRRELWRSLDRGYPYDYFLYDGFCLDQSYKDMLAILGRSGSIRRLLLVGELDRREKRLLFEWSKGHGLSISAMSDRPLGQIALAALIKRDRGCPDLLCGIAWGDSWEDEVRSFSNLPWRDSA